jgi:hypothetical protein
MKILYLCTISINQIDSRFSEYLSGCPIAENRKENGNQKKEIKD